MTVERVTDQGYLQTQQYGDAKNLNARIALHARFSVNRQPWQQWVFQNLRLPEQCRVLELGCGPGNLWRDNAAHLPAGWRLALTDFSPGMLAQARRNVQHMGPCTFALVDAQSIPFADGVFDAVVANHMIYHVSDRARALAEVRRVLKPGGRFYAATVGARHMCELDDLVTHFDPQIAESGIGLGKPYTPFSLENGRAQLSAVFPHVQLHRYKDALEVAEAAPLVDYIQSGTDMLDDEKLAELTLFVQRRLDEQGVIRIHKDSGLFVAW